MIANHKLMENRTGIFRGSFGNLSGSRTELIKDLTNAPHDTCDCFWEPSNFGVYSSSSPVEYLFHPNPFPTLQANSGNVFEKATTEAESGSLEDVLQQTITSQRVSDFHACFVRHSTHR